MFEVFDPRDGVPLWTVRWKLVARFLAWFWGLDYARTGEGWCEPSCPECEED